MAEDEAVAAAAAAEEEDEDEDTPGMAKRTANTLSSHRNGSRHSSSPGSTCPLGGERSSPSFSPPPSRPPSPVDAPPSVRMMSADGSMNHGLRPCP